MAISTAKEVSALVASVVAVISVLVSALLWIDHRYMTAVAKGDLNVQIFHVSSEIIDLEGTKALYEYRLQDTGTLSMADQNRYQVILQKIDAATEARRLLVEERASL